jgi:hypothetical protein
VPRLADQLGLTEEQLPEFDTAFRKYHAKITEAETKNAVAVHQYFYEMGKEILPLLDADQATAFRETHRKICTVFLPPIPRGGDVGQHHCPTLWQ